jgi:hypothetical protein
MVDFYYHLVNKDETGLRAHFEGGMMDQNRKTRPATYRIRVRECLEHRFVDWMDDLTLIPQDNGETLLISTFPDQPALRGFLDQLWNLNITVITVERIENES